MIFMLLFIFCSTGFTYASDTSLGSIEADDYITVPVYDSFEEAEEAMKEQQSLVSSYSGSGGTSECTIKPYIVRDAPFGTSSEIYFDISSDFSINAVRFTELIVESEYLGINYLKMKPKSGSTYCTFNTGTIMYGKRTICRDFDIPMSEDRVRVRTKGMGVYKVTSSMWLSCQYQISGY